MILRNCPVRIDIDMLANSNFPYIAILQIFDLELYFSNSYLLSPIVHLLSHYVYLVISEDNNL